MEEVQIGRAHRRAYWERLPSLLAAPRQIAVWEPVRSDFAQVAA
ncbi:hypothetical protein [Vulgatibacter sp.]